MTVRTKRTTRLLSSGLCALLLPQIAHADTTAPCNTGPGAGSLECGVDATTTYSDAYDALWATAIGNGASAIAD